MEFKDYKYCIVADEHDRPMTFSQPDEQLCYCDDEYWVDDVLPLRVVTTRTARRQIRVSIKNRNAWGMDVPKYKLIPVTAKIFT